MAHFSFMKRFMLSIFVLKTKQKTFYYMRSSNFVDVCILTKLLCNI